MKQNQTECSTPGNRSFSGCTQQAELLWGWPGWAAGLCPQFRSTSVWFCYRPCVVMLSWTSATGSVECQYQHWNSYSGRQDPQPRDVSPSNIVSLLVFYVSSMGYIVAWLCCLRAGSEGEFLMTGVIKITPNPLPRWSWRNCSGERLSSQAPWS